MMKKGLLCAALFISTAFATAQADVQLKGLLEKDVQALKEMAFFYGPLFCKTIIKDVHILKPSTLARLNLKKFKFEENNYWDLDEILLST